MSVLRNKRSPLSCQPCRQRKIKCARDGCPCTTCVRRGVPNSHCVYATKGSANRTTDSAEQPTVESQRLEILQSLTVEQSPQLAARVERLERLLSEQCQLPAQEPPLPLSRSPGVTATLSEFTTRGGTSHGNQFTSAPNGLLRKYESGHVRFIPSTSTWNVLQDTSGRALPDGDCGSVDVITLQFPIGESDAPKPQDILSKLPPADLCLELKDTYFRSFSPVKHI